LHGILSCCTFVLSNKANGASSCLLYYQRSHFFSQSIFYFMKKLLVLAALAFAATATFAQSAAAPATPTEAKTTKTAKKAKKVKKVKAAAVTTSATAGKPAAIVAAPAPAAPVKAATTAPAPVAAAASASSKAGMKFETDLIDYGTIKKGGDPLRKFTFKNTGSEPLIIKNAQGSCGCTVPTYPHEPIMPGQSASIDVRYDTQRVGAFTKTVTLTTNSADAETKVLTIKGLVEDVAGAATPPTSGH
jgi:hypothetical protein